MHHFCGSQYWKSAVFALGKMIFSGAHSIVTPYNRSECLQIHILSFFKGFSKAKIWCFNWFWCKKVCFESLNFDQITDLEAFGSVNRSECLQIHILSFFKGFSKAKIWCFNWFWCKKVCFESLNFDQITDLEAFGSVVGGHNWMRFFALGNWHHLENVPAPRTPPFDFA